MNNNCPSCSAKTGNFHNEWCDLEPCPVCGHQLINCFCSHPLKNDSERIKWIGDYSNYPPKEQHPKPHMVFNAFSYLVQFDFLPEPERSLVQERVMNFLKKDSE